MGHTFYILMALLAGLLWLCLQPLPCAIAPCNGRPPLMILGRRISLPTTEEDESESSPQDKGSCLAAPDHAFLFAHPALPR